jgi:hypothetical protein
LLMMPSSHCSPCPSVIPMLLNQWRYYCLTSMSLLDERVKLCHSQFKSGLCRNESVECLTTIRFLSKTTGAAWQFCNFHQWPWKFFRTMPRQNKAFPPSLLEKIGTPTKLELSPLAIVRLNPAIRSNDSIADEPFT